MLLGYSFPLSLQQLVEPIHLAKHVKRAVKKTTAAETICSVYQIHMVALVQQDGWDWNVIKVKDMRNSEESLVCCTWEI